MTKSKCSLTARLLLLLLLSGALHLGAAEGESKKSSVRIVVLKGAYEDHPSAVGLDPLMLLSGDVEKPNSFFALCEKIDDLAGTDEVQHIVFDLSGPDFKMNLAQLSELG